jgi:hypothetical protein
VTDKSGSWFYVEISIYNCDTDALVLRRTVRVR